MSIFIWFKWFKMYIESRAWWICHAQKNVLMFCLWLREWFVLYRSISFYIAPYRFIPLARSESLYIVLYRSIYFRCSWIPENLNTNTNCIDDQNVVNFTVRRYLDSLKMIESLQRQGRTRLTEQSQRADARLHVWIIKIWKKATPEDESAYVPL